jgi:hypothetical protein
LTFKFARRFLVIFIPPLLVMGLGVWMLFNVGGLVSTAVVVAGYLLLPLTPVWAYPIIERMEDRLDRR